MAADTSESTRQVLQEARAASQDETVVFRLKGRSGGAAPPPEETVRLAHDLIERASANHGHRPKKMNIFENLGSFVVQGDAALLLHLIDQPEVAAATLNRRSNEKPSLPIRKGPATSKGWTDVSD